MSPDDLPWPKQLQKLMSTNIIFASPGNRIGLMEALDLSALQQEQFTSEYIKY